MKVLDHGYLKLIDAWGSDRRIIEAARMSTDKGFLGWGTRPDCTVCKGTGKVYDQDESIECPRSRGPNPECVSGDETLLRYLYRNQHATPFEFGGMVIEVQAPIFVFREWHRHRTQSYNEMSARYTPLPDLNYIPTVERLMLNSKTNKQAGTAAGAEELTVEWAEMFQEQLRTMYVMQEQLYQQALQKGIPKELARIHLPVGRYSRMRASTCLRNWLAFLTLRQAPNAQFEIRQYANAMHGLLVDAFPRTKLFDQ
jgi:thymidylate synthase (FAD)